MKGGQDGGVVTGAINAARSLCGALQSAGLGLPAQLARALFAASSLHLFSPHRTRTGTWSRQKASAGVIRTARRWSDVYVEDYSLQASSMVTNHSAHRIAAIQPSIPQLSHFGRHSLMHLTQPHAVPDDPR